MKRCLVILFLLFESTNCLLATSQFWRDVDFIQQSYIKTGSIKVSVAFQYFNDFSLPNVDYNLTAYMMLSGHKYYSRLGTMEMIMNGDKGLLIDHGKKYVLYANPKRIKNGHADQFDIKDIRSLIDTSKSRIDTTYILSESDSIRTYYIGFRPNGYYKYMHFSFNYKTGMLTTVEYFMRHNELEKMGRVLIRYNSNYNLTNDDMAAMNMDKYLESGPTPKLKSKYRDYEFIIDNDK